MRSAGEHRTRENSDLVLTEISAKTRLRDVQKITNENNIYFTLLKLNVLEKYYVKLFYALYQLFRLPKICQEIAVTYNKRRLTSPTKAVGGTLSM